MVSSPLVDNTFVENENSSKVAGALYVSKRSVTGWPFLDPPGIPKVDSQLKKLKGLLKK